MGTGETSKYRIIIGDLQAELDGISGQLAELQDREEWLKKAIQFYVSKVHDSGDPSLFMPPTEPQWYVKPEVRKKWGHLEAAKAFLEFKRKLCSVKSIIEGLRNLGHDLPGREYPAISKPLNDEYQSGDTDLVKYEIPKGRVKIVLWGLKKFESEYPSPDEIDLNNYK